MHRCSGSNHFPSSITELGRHFTEGRVLEDQSRRQKISSNTSRAFDGDLMKRSVKVLIVELP